MAEPEQLLDVQFEDRCFHLNPSGGRDAVATQFAAGKFEPPLPSVFFHSVKRWPGLVLDVGANGGIYSILACLADDTVSVWAFEPFPEAIRALRRNTDINGLRNRVRIRRKALSDVNGAAPLYIPDPAHGLLESSASLDVDFKPHVATIEVERRKLDDIALPATPTVCKVDIEGHEHAFLRGAEHTIETARPILFVEILPRAHLEFLDSFRRKLAYVDIRLRPTEAVESEKVIFDMDAWNHALVPRERYRDFLDVLRAANLSAASVADPNVGASAAP